MTASVPQNDPKAAYLAQRAAIDAAIARVLASGRYILGDETSSFEAEFATAMGCRHGIGVGNGTDALILALRALGIGAGQTVATVSHTAVATVAATVPAHC
jgi:dTDP-4-amino-4,6-dideoxygalactose transaminase